MKALLLFCCLFTFELSSSAQINPDSTRRSGPLRHFDLCFNWFELGAAKSLITKQLDDLPPGINEYLNNKKNGTHYGFFGLTCYYKHRFGFGLMYNYYEFGAHSDRFHEYLTNQYPNYYVPKIVSDHWYSIETVSLNFSYRKHFKYFFIEPKLRIDFNSYQSYGNSFRLKEKGSNQYIQLNISEQNKGLKNAYHAMFNITHQFRRMDGFPLSLELGGCVDLFVTPIKSNFSLSETPYGTEGTTTVYDANRWNPAMCFSLVLNAYF